MVRLVTVLTSLADDHLVLLRVNLRSRESVSCSLRVSNADVERQSKQKVAIVKKYPIIAVSRQYVAIFTGSWA